MIVRISPAEAAAVVGFIDDILRDSGGRWAFGLMDALDRDTAGGLNKLFRALTGENHVKFMSVFGSIPAPSDVPGNILLAPDITQEPAE